VLEHAGPRDHAFLGDVTDQHEHETAPLGDPDQFLRRGTHLRDGAGRRVERVHRHGLDRVDDDGGRGIGVVQRGDDIRYRGLGRQLYVRPADTEPSARSRTCSIASSPEI
jgi:hypothetical protein